MICVEITADGARQRGASASGSSSASGVRRICGSVVAAAPEWAALGAEIAVPAAGGCQGGDHPAFGDAAVARDALDALAGGEMKQSHLQFLLFELGGVSQQGANQGIAQTLTQCREPSRYGAGRAAGEIGDVLEGESRAGSQFQDAAVALREIGELIEHTLDVGRRAEPGVVGAILGGAN